MERFDTVDGFRSAMDGVRSRTQVVGLVPTLGALHEGHRSLIRRAAQDCDAVAVTVFVNPLQFAPDEDFEAYPRELERDAASAASSGATHLFAPSQQEMYPAPVLTEVRVPALAGLLEGAARPEHFGGVATVVTKLFAIAGPCRAYFGEKDFQQLAIVRRVAADLSLPVEVVACPTVRELDGLAMSSRNVYLEGDEREAAVVLHRALQAGAAAIVAGERDGESVCSLMASIIEAEPRAKLDYVTVADPGSLSPLDRLEPGQAVRLLGAAQVGRPRLLDNLGVVVPG